MSAEAGFGALLRRYRTAAGMSQEALAERAGLSVDAISALEQGRRYEPAAERLLDRAGRTADALMAEGAAMSASELAAEILATDR